VGPGTDTSCPTVKRVVGREQSSLMINNDRMGKERVTTLRNIPLTIGEIGAESLRLSNLSYY